MRDSIMQSVANHETSYNPRYLGLLFEVSYVGVQLLRLQHTRPLTPQKASGTRKHFS